MAWAAELTSDGALVTELQFDDHAANGARIQALCPGGAVARGAHARSVPIESFRMVTIDFDQASLTNDAGVLAEFGGPRAAKMCVSSGEGWVLGGSIEKEVALWSFTGDEWREVDLPPAMTADPGNQQVRNLAAGDDWLVVQIKDRSVHGGDVIWLRTAASWVRLDNPVDAADPSLVHIIDVELVGDQLFVVGSERGLPKLWSVDLATVTGGTSPD